MKHTHSYIYYYHDEYASSSTVEYRVKSQFRQHLYRTLRVALLPFILLAQPQQFPTFFSVSFSLQIQIPSISQNRHYYHHGSTTGSNKRLKNRNSRSNVLQSSVGVDANSSTGSSTSDDDSSGRLQQQQLVGIAVETPIQSLISQNEQLVTNTLENPIDIDVSAAAFQSTTTIDEGSNTQELLLDDELLRKNIFNAVLLSLTFGYAAYTIFNIDHGMTRGWTQSEIAMRIPLDNWLNYESSLTDRPVATKTAINVIIYLLGDWLSQTAFSGNNILNFNAARTIRNGFIGLCFGPLVHEYYQFSDHILPVDGGMFVRLQKIIMDQTIYLSVKCSIYISAVGLLQGDDIATVKQNVQTKLPNIVLTAWKFWPLVHLVTYGVIPARHRILWVNCVDLIWNAILATMSQKKTTATDNDNNEDTGCDPNVRQAVNGVENSASAPLIYEATISDEHSTTAMVESVAASDASTSSSVSSIATTIVTPESSIEK